MISCGGRRVSRGWSRPSSSRSAAARTASSATGDRAWNYVAVGTGHPDGIDFWARFVDALHAAGYDGPMFIENED